MKINLLIPAFVVAHMVCVALYMYDPNLMHYHSSGWAVFFHSTQSFFLFAVLILFIFTEQKMHFDNYYLLIWSFFNLTLTLAYVAQYFKTIQHTYGFIIAIVSLAITLSIILLNTISFGYYNKKYEND